ncbi:atrial natriuretic peptide receptor 1-like [Paramacrobiotus metropolitanus]|uniref:atrial natriuretic peptide receptor 1-like n=1 Tax=Paramacrobiotus metropolitanus TaxID=2943436 RepID=UPI002445CCE9|nr:atrial natriuretic peptide receptor 1-like [Paramacrobiotus metropolitanus]
MPPLITVTLLCFMAHSRNFFPGIPYTAPAFQIAVEQVNAAGRLNVSLVILSRADLMVCDDVIKQWHLVAEFYYTHWDGRSLMVLFLSGCEENPDLRNLAREWDILLIGSSFNGNNPTIFPTAVSFTPGDSYPLSQAMLSVFDRFDWTNIVIIHENNTVANPIQAMITIRMRAALKLMPATRALRYSFLYLPADSTDKRLPYEELLMRVQPISRVVVLMFPAKIVRMFMIAAHRLGMANGEYVYIMGEPFKSVRRWGTLIPRLNDTDDAVAQEAFPSLLQITSNCHNGVNNAMQTVMQEIRQRGIDQYDALYDADEEPNPMTMAAYFAVKALAKIFVENEDNVAFLRSGRNLARQFYNRTFVFPEISISVDNTGIRINPYCIKTYNASAETFQTVMRHLGTKLTVYQNRSIDWRTPDNQPPLNVPVCGYLGDSGPCLEKLVQKRNLILLIILAIGGGVGFLVAGVWLIRRQSADSGEWWILDADDLITHEAYTLATESAETLERRQRLMTMQSGKRVVHYYKGHPVSVTQRATLRALKPENFLRVIGIVERDRAAFFVMEYAPRGTLAVFMDKSAVDPELRVTLIYDLLKGISVVHASIFLRHGYLSPSICWVDRNFVLKISETGFYDIIRNCLNHNAEIPAETISRHFIAPELPTPSSRDPWMLAQHATPTCDIYTAGCIMAWMMDNEAGSKDPALVNLAGKCQSANYYERPLIRDVIAEYRSITLVTDDKLVENLLRKMETYNGRLEQVVHDRTVELRREQLLSMELLQEMLPRVVVQQLVRGIPVSAELFHHTSVSFAILTGFQEYCATTPPVIVIDVLNIIFTLFDGCLKECDAYKVETVSDCYMAASGLPVANGDKHAGELCRLAVNMNECFLCIPRLGRDGKLQLKIGIQSGPCAAGVVGNKRPRYCLFGSTVNTASRLAYSAELLRIHLGPETARLIAEETSFTAVSRGTVNLKVLWTAKLNGVINT